MRERLSRGRNPSLNGRSRRGISINSQSTQLSTKSNNKINLPIISSNQTDNSTQYCLKTFKRSQFQNKTFFDDKLPSTIKNEVYEIESLKTSENNQDLLINEKPKKCFKCKYESLIEKQLSKISIDNKQVHSNISNYNPQEYLKDYLELLCQQCKASINKK